MGGFTIFILKYFYNQYIISLFAERKILINIYKTMNELLKYLGVIILLLGVGVLAFPFLSGEQSNTFLLVGLFLILGGFFAHIIINKKIE